MKCILSILLSFLLICTAFPLHAASADTENAAPPPLTRLAFVTALAAMHNIETDAGEWAHSLGLIIGNEHGDLMLDDPITREQASLIVDRYLALCGIYGASIEGMPLYSDDSTISSWARVAVYHMTAYGFLPPGVGNKFHPLNIFTTAEAEFCIERLIPFSKQFGQQ